MRIAICDTNTADRETAAAALNRWSAFRTEIMNISFFDSGEDFIVCHNQNPFDAVLLDTNISGSSGMEIARQLRNTDRSVRIVFLTSEPEYALEAFAVRAFDYLLKPLVYDRFAMMLNNLADEINFSSDYLLLQYEGTHRKCHFHQISHLEVQCHKVHIHLTDGSTIEVNQPLHTFEEKLRASRLFCKSHRSYIVAFPQVSSFTYGEIIMQNGDSIPLSRTWVKNFKEKYCSYISAN